MNTSKRLAIACFLAAVGLSMLGGCRSLPNVKGSEIHSRTSTLGVVVEANATGVNVTDATMKAESAEWKISFPGFDHQTRVKDYQQKRPKEDADKP